MSQPNNCKTMLSFFPKRHAGFSCTPLPFERARKLLPVTVSSNLGPSNASSDGDFMPNIANADIKQSARLIVCFFTALGILVKISRTIPSRPLADRDFFSWLWGWYFIGRHRVKILNNKDRLAPKRGPQAGMIAETASRSLEGDNIFLFL